jgi:hypothetical protein
MRSKLKYSRAFTELRCSAISSPITPSIDHTVTINEHMSSDFTLDTHSYQPLVNRTSMGNDFFVKCSSRSVDDNGNSSNDAHSIEIATGTKGFLQDFHFSLLEFVFFCALVFA